MFFGEVWTSLKRALHQAVFTFDKYEVFTSSLMRGVSAGTLSLIKIV